MNRIFALSGFTAFAVLYALFFVARADAAVILMAASAGCAFVSLLIKRHDFLLPLVFFAAGLSCLLFLIFNAEQGRLRTFAGQKISVEATVYEMPYKAKDRERHYAVCELEKVNGEKASGKLRLSFAPSADGIDPGNLETGNRISFTGTAYLPGAGQADIERYFLGEDILLGAYAVKNLIVTVPETRSLRYHFQNIRNRVAEKISENFSDRTSGVLLGVLTGDREYIDDETDESFRKAGISHIMAVSGLHLSVWVFFISSLLSDDRRFSRIKYILLLAVVVFVMLLAGMSKSVCRAGFMSAVHIIGCMLERKSDSLNSLGFAVFVMVLLNPSCVFSLSFQLSVLSTLSIITLAKACTESVRNFFEYEGYKKSVGIKILKICFDSFAISMSVLMFTFLIQAYEFAGLSSVSALSNLLMIPVVTPIMILSGLYVVVASVPFIAYPIAFAADKLAEYVIWVSAVLSKPEWAFLTLEKSDIPGLLLLSAGVITFFILVFRKNIIRFFGRYFATRVFMCYNYLKYQLGGYGNGGIW